MVELFANNGDPDQFPRSAASDLGLHCLPVICLGVFSLQWVKFLKRLYFLTLWMEVVHTCPGVRYWSGVLCYTSTTHIYDLEVKVMDLKKKYLCLSFWLKFLEAKRDSGELCCSGTALILETEDTILAFYLLLFTSDLVKIYSHIYFINL